MVPVLPFLPDQFRGLASSNAICPGIPQEPMRIKETAHQFASSERAGIASHGIQIFISTYIDSIE
jgi:LDH2 family malate/lactate/ureidoglycolate dehydrogenase